MESKFYIGILFSLLISFSVSLYSTGSPVVILNQSNFKKEVLDSKDIWLIEFFAPWCGHCKAFAPEYEKAARALKGIFKIGAVDADSEKSLASQFGISGFPTVKFFGENKKSPVDYQGGRTADAVVTFMMNKAKEIANSRLNGKKSTSSNTKSNTNANAGKKKTATPATDKDVVVLDDSNFDDIVYNSKDMWLIEYYAPWCGHCQKLQPEWNQAATQLKGQIKFGKVDATVNNGLAQRFGVRGYPTIKIFAPGDNKSDSKAEEYQGPREAAGIVQFALDKLEKYGYVPDTPQLVNQSILKETCIDRVGICIVVFLPNIADSSANERNKYLNQLKEASKGSRGKPIYYLWAQGGDFFDFEDKLHLSFGYPAVVAINYNKKKYAVCRTAFTKDNLNDFVVSLLIGKEPLMNLPDTGKLKTVKEWDGKDAPVMEPEHDDDL